MAVVLSPFLDVARKASKNIRKTQSILPIATKNCLTSSLLTGDDLALRTSVSSPVMYDREMTQLLYNRTEFFSEDNQPIELSYVKFSKEISNIDKLHLMWALYKSSYDTLDNERKIKCQNNDCENTIVSTIELDDLIHDDTYVFWDEETNFYEYIFPINIEYGDVKYEFASCLPSIADNNVILGTVSNQILQNNLEKIGTMFTKSQELALVVKAMRISSKSDSFPQAETSNIQEILMVAETSLPKSVSDEFFEKYEERFGKYDPKFYFDVQCDVCKTKFKYDVDLEVEFFRRSLFGGRSSE